MEEQVLGLIQKRIENILSDTPGDQDAPTIPTLSPSASNLLQKIFADLAVLEKERPNVSSKKKEEEPLSFPPAVEIFLSYCWTNSSDAKEKGQVKKCVGTTDPRVVYQSMTKSGLPGWIDFDFLGENCHGDVSGLCSGISHCKLFVAFISNEYADDELCCLQFEYAKKTLRLPIIPVVVGTGWDWRKSKLGFLLASDLFIDMTKPEMYNQKLDELLGRIRLLIGKSAKKEEYLKEVPKVDPSNPKSGDGFEVRCSSTFLNFGSKFSNEKVVYASNGQFSNGANSIMNTAYWWPVTIIETKGEMVHVAYTGYEDDPNWKSGMEKKSDLRLVQYASPSSEVNQLKVGQKVECRLFQKGGYCWVVGLVEQLKSDGSVFVRIKPRHPQEKDVVDAVVVTRAQIRIPNPGEELILSKSVSQEGGVLNLNDPDFFLSYCWRNSTESFRKGEVPSAVGDTDPRVIQNLLLKNSDLLGWLDIQQLGRSGLFDDICAGLVKSKLVLACVSNEYAMSENCCLEFEFALKTLRVPLIPVAVGDNMGWKQTKIGFLIGDREVIDMTTSSCLDLGDFQQKMREIAGRVELLTGKEGTKESYMKEVPQVIPGNPKVGDGFEVLVRGVYLNFSSYFSKEKTIFQKTGEFSNGEKALLNVDYWWPVTISEVKKNKINVAYLGYEDDPDWCSAWHNKADLRPVQYSDPLSDLTSLGTGDKVECRLFQRGGYCWVAGKVHELGTDGSITVKFDVGKKGKENIDRVVVSRSQLRLI